MNWKTYIIIIVTVICTQLKQRLKNNYFKLKNDCTPFFGGPFIYFTYNKFLCIFTTDDKWIFKIMLLWQIESY